MVDCAIISVISDIISMGAFSSQRIASVVVAWSVLDAFIKRIWRSCSILDKTPIASRIKRHFAIKTCCIARKLRFGKHPRDNIEERYRIATWARAYIALGDTECRPINRSGTAFNGAAFLRGLRG